MHPGEEPLKNSSNPSSSSFPVPDISLSETEFLRDLYDRARQSGALDPLFPGMVFYNVPGYLMKNLWPEKLEKWKKKPALMGFAANESGWKGKLDALQSTLEPDTGLVSLNKNFVMEGDSIALCAVKRMGHKDPSEIALCWIPLPSPGITLTAREDSESRFEYEGETFLHYRMSGQITLPPNETLLIPAARYRRLGPVFMLREITGLGAIALGILAHHGIALDAESYFRDCGNNRASGRPRKEDLIQAREFIARLCENVAARHPLWDRMNSLP